MRRSHSHDLMILFPGSWSTLPLPACGERVGVRGPISYAQNRGRAPSPGLLRNPTSPRAAGRGGIAASRASFPLFLGNALLTAALIVAHAAAARAEVQKFLSMCPGQKLCPSYQLVLTPPDGWVVDSKASDENKVQIMVPKGQTFASAEPLIYVQVFYQADKTQPLADFARVSNARWLAANPKAKITELPAVERTNGKPAFLRFAFDNPGKAQQAYEVGALGVDSDKDGNGFVLDVVMSGNSKAALDRADAAYSAFLKAH
jgi:hypothetical protein